MLAFSSTTMFSNIIAGNMMRFTRPFITGDFIRVNDYAGRVTERGLFDCEIQTENRELIVIPNNFLINNPVTVGFTWTPIVIDLGFTWIPIVTMPRLRLIPKSN